MCDGGIDCTLATGAEPGDGKGWMGVTLVCNAVSAYTDCCGVRTFTSEHLLGLQLGQSRGLAGRAGRGGSVWTVVEGICLSRPGLRSME